MQRIEVTQAELAALIRNCQQVNLAFGPGWAALKYDPAGKLPEAVIELGVMRGVLTPDEGKRLKEGGQA